MLRTTRGHANDNSRENHDPPVLICEECRRPMEFLATLPEIVTLPAVYAYRCLPCLRVDTIDLGKTHRAQTHP